jgi:hypothetical protein
MNPVLLIFTQITITGCGFLVYFLYALRRDSRNSGKSKVQIRPTSTHIGKSNVVELETSGKVHVRKVRSASGR